MSTMDPKGIEDRGTNGGAERRLLLVDGDYSLCWALQRGLERRGYKVQLAHSVSHALAVLSDRPPSHAVVALRLPGASGLTLLPALKVANPAMRIVVMTGYASIATAVEAIKLGAIHYLEKPVDATMLDVAFDHVSGDAHIALRPQPVSARRLAWEYIQDVVTEYHGNISAAARALGMHRRTLQRKLGKHPARQ